MPYPDLNLRQSRIRILTIKLRILAFLSKRCPPLHPIESKYRIMCAGASWRSSLNWTLPRSVRSSGPRIMKATSLVSCLSRKEWLCFGVTSVWAVLSWRNEICYLNIFFTVPMQTLLMEFSQLTSGSVLFSRTIMSSPLVFSIARFLVDQLQYVVNYEIFSLTTYVRLIVVYANLFVLNALIVY